MKQIVRQSVKLPRRREELSSARAPAFHQRLLFERILRSPGAQTMTKISPTASPIVAIRNDWLTSTPVLPEAILVGPLSALCFLSRSAL